MIKRQYTYEEEQDRKALAVTLRAYKFMFKQVNKGNKSFIKWARAVKQRFFA